MTPVDIDKLKELLKLATGLPWQQKNENEPDVIVGNVDGEIIDGATHYSYDTIAECMDNPRTDLPLIVAAVNSLPALIAKAERVDAMERALTEAATTFDQFAAALREHDPAAMAQEIAVAELAATDARNALSPKESE